MDNFSIEGTLIIGSILIFLNIIAKKISTEFCIPVLLIFLGINILTSSDRIRGIQFDNSYITQMLGSIALSIILFRWGLETRFEKIKLIFIPGLILLTAGVFLSAITLDLFAYLAYGFWLKESMVFGSLVASICTTAVFSILKYKNLKKNKLISLLEFESGSNGPMAYFLVFFFMLLSSGENMTLENGLIVFIRGIALGFILGIYMG